MKKKSVERKKRTTCLTALLLVAALLTSTQSITSLAATVSENVTAVEEKNSIEVIQPDSQEKETDTDTENLAEDVPDGKETEEDGLTEDGLTEDQAEEYADSPVMTGSFSEEVNKAGEVPTGTPANPVHNCTEEDDGSDTTTWSYVYFGSYPKSEVTDEDTIAAIEAKIEEISVSDNNYPGEKAETGTDVWVNGTKYRRISIDDANDPFYFGSNYYRYFKWERIKWRVLWNDGTNLFVMADTALDCKNYNEEWGACITWEVCTLRSWLNDTFYETAFDTKEQNAIVEWSIENEDNLDYNTLGGNDTRDKIYLLSISEACNPAYGFCQNAGTRSLSRKMKESYYAHARGTWIGIDDVDEGTCPWWLRSPGREFHKGQNAAVVNSSGFIYKDGSEVDFDNDGIVPVLHINLSSNVWAETNDGTSGEGGEDRILASLKATKTKTTYIQGESLNLDDLTVEAAYSLHNSKTLQKEAYTTNAADIDMNVVGEKKLTISYMENDVTKTADIILVVNKKPEEKPEEKPEKKPEDNPGGNPSDNPGGNPSDNPGGNPSTNPGGNAEGDAQDNQNQPVKVTKLTIEAPDKKLAAGKKVKLAVTVAPADATNQAVTWTTSNKKYATIDQNGKLTLKKAGAGKTVTITATAQDGSGVKATIKITIMKDAVKSLKLKAPSKTLKAGKTMTIKTTIKTTGKKANKTLKWTSSNENFATVNNKGKVTAKKAGKGKTVTITAQTTDGSGKKAKVKIKIK